MPNHRDFAPGRWIAPVLAGAIAGPALQVQQADLSGWPVYALALVAGLALGAAAGAWRPRWRAAPLLAAAALLGFGICGLRAERFIAAGLDPALEGQDLEIVGVVAAMPQRSDSGLRFRFEVESATAGGAPVRLVPQIALGWYGGVTPTAAGLMELQRQPAELLPGERWQLAARLKAPHGNSNPHGFDYELWLWEQGVQATGSVRAGPRDPPPRRLDQTWRHPVERARQRVRDAVFVQVPEHQTAGVLAALVAGDQTAIERADWDVFRATGVAHLMSISGLHITMFAWAAALLVRSVWRRSARLCLAWPAQHAAVLGGMALATAYALFSGWGVPAQRTIWMLATVGVLRLSGRHWPWPVVWLLAAAVVVTVDPWALLQPGFWLSFVAVGVLFAGDPGQPTAPAGQRDGRMRRLARTVGAAVREQWVVTLALTPLSLLLFGQASLVGLLANAIAIPWVTLVITPLALAGVLVAPVWNIAGRAVELLQVVLQWFAGLPFATVSVAAAPWWAAGAGVLGGVLLVLRLPWHVRLMALPLLLPVALWQPARPEPGQFELLAADIGQGNAVIVRTAGHTLVYDSGPRYGLDSDAGTRVLLPLLRAFDERVDLLVLSHVDSDHTGGAAAVLAQQPGAALLSSLDGSHELAALRLTSRCTAGQRWSWDGVDFQILHPEPADYQRPAKANALSCVLRVSNGARAALLAGDIELPQEARLAAAGSLRADWLLVPHHGSKTSSSPAFLAGVQPAVALVQAGYRNRFGHPAAAVVERYRESGIALIDSARCGAAWWRSSDATVHCQRAAAPRYWQHRIAPLPAGGP